MKKPKKPNSTIPATPSFDILDAFHSMRLATLAIPDCRDSTDTERKDADDFFATNFYAKNLTLVTNVTNRQVPFLKNKKGYK